MTTHLIFLILAVVSFVLASFRVQAPLDFTPLGFAFVVLAFAF